MTKSRPTPRLWLAPTLGALLLASACSEDGQSFGEGKCPDLPLYRWEGVTTGTGDKAVTTWTRIDVKTSRPLTDAGMSPIKAAQEKGTKTGRCITPGGVAKDLDGSGGASGTGGAPSDAGGD